MKRRYEAIGLNSGRFVFRHHGACVTARFEGGNRTLGRNAVMETDNPIVQAAIESDSRFGNLFKRVM